MNETTAIVHDLKTKKNRVENIIDAKTWDHNFILFPTLTYIYKYEAEV